MDDSNADNADTQVSDPTAPIRPGQPPAVAAPKSGQKKGGGFRRAFFVFLLLFVMIGLIAIGALASARFGAVLSEVDSLNAQLNEAQTELGQTQAGLEQAQTDLDDLSQALQDLAEESARAQSDLESQVRYGLLLQQAQNEVAKAILSLVQDDIGQARREITALRASLLAAADLADEDGAAALAGLEVRAGQAETDLSNNAFASQQTLEVIWRELDELSAAMRGDQ